MKTNIILSLVMLLSIGAWAQKRAMTVDDTKTWNKITNKQISSNGEYVSYNITPNKGDENLYLYNNKTNKTLKFERGKNAKIGFNNNLIIFKIAVQEDSLRLKKLAKLNADQLPKDSLGIYLFNQDSLIKVEKIKAYYIAEENSEWLAYKYDFTEPKDTSKTDSVLTDSVLTKTDRITTKKEYKQEGHRLVILNTTNLEQFVFENIKDVVVSKNGNIFTFTQVIKDSLDTARVFTFNTLSKTKKLIFEKEGTIDEIEIDNKGAQIVYSFSTDTVENKKYSLWYYNVNKDQSNIIIDTTASFLPRNWGLSINKSPRFSDSGERLYFGAAPFPAAEPEDSLLDNEKVKLDIWSWNDKLLQPQQLKRLKQDNNRYFKYVYNLKKKQFIQLEDSLTDVKYRVDIDPQYFLGTSDYPYLEMISWTPDAPSDYYIISAKTGEKRTLAKKVIWDTKISPLGKYTLAWDMEKEYWLIIDNKTLKQTILTNKINDIFYNEKHSTPSMRESQHMVGWSEDEKFVFIYSQYDIWRFSTDGKKQAQNLTHADKSEKIEFNFQNLDYDKVYLPSDQFMMHTFNHETMAESYQLLDLKTLKKTIVIEENKAFLPPIKAKNADKLIWGNATFNEFPELKYSDVNYTNIKILTKANPQQDNINWGKISLTQWCDFNNDTLKGLLILPEDFDPNKKYPVIVYFYEKYSENLNRYWTPRPSHSTINFSFYASNGYIVFVPDINYGTGLPGKDAYNAIVSGTQHISKLPFVNTNKIGIQGQSWGGYQVAYLVTQTNMFACAMAGAPVSNMTSAYGGIRWASGMSRMFQYEHTQSRIGGTLWEKRDKYIENSPIFFADRVETPLLIMHNDGDGAVPWYQGIEYFVALRRLNKPAWLLNYNGDSHNLRKWPNRVDLSIRMFGFFEHYLKDKKAPEWLEKGLPAIKKGKELRY